MKVFRYLVFEERC